MKAEDIHQAFDAWRQLHTRLAWIPQTEADPNVHSSSWFGGSPLLLSATQWPSCRQCGKPMRFFLQLDLSELPEKFHTPTRTGLLQLFYCSNDDGGCNTWKPFSGTHAIWIESSDGEAIHCDGVTPFNKTVITGWKEIPDTPHPGEHKACGITYDYDFDKGVVNVKCNNPEMAFDGLPIDSGVAESISVAADGDKLGGWPNWVQGVEYPNCPECGNQMELVLQVDSEDNLPYRFGDAGCAHLTQCRRHPNMLAFGWACC